MCSLFSFFHQSIENANFGLALTASPQSAATCSAVRGATAAAIDAGGAGPGGGVGRHDEDTAADIVAADTDTAVVGYIRTPAE